jgi:N-acetylneuraminic acid mutarotase
LFGGTDHDDRKNDLYCFDIYTSNWEKMIHQGDIPQARSGARGLAYQDSLYFFGGYSKQSGEYFKDLFRYDLNRKRWELVQTEGIPPESRTDHTIVLYGNSFYVYGGYDGVTRFGDLHKCSVNKGFKWK